jgi:hypothetical protein
MRSPTLGMRGMLYLCLISPISIPLAEQRVEVHVLPQVPGNRVTASRGEDARWAGAP